MPVLIEATFIPFRDVIISDGLVMPHGKTVQRYLYGCKEKRYTD